MGDVGGRCRALGSLAVLAGFLLFRLGDIPQAGARVEYRGRRFTVLEMDRNRIARVRIEKLPAAKDDGLPLGQPR